MILNLSDDSALALLELVNAASESLLAKIPRQKGQRQKDSIVFLQHLGIVKHRLDVNLGVSAFRGPIEWGFPLHGKPPPPFEGPLDRIVKIS